jgi:hypothetical protein
MAIPLGTTARQLQALARAALAAVIVLAMLAWWWPGYRRWGAAAAGVAGVLVLWVLWRIVSADRKVPGHPIHLVLLLPAVVLSVHLGGIALGTPAGSTWQLAGALDVSMVFVQFGLTALTVMLTQSLLPDPIRHVVVPTLCGAAMVIGPGAALAWAGGGPARPALALLAFAGVGVWIAMSLSFAPPRLVVQASCLHSGVQTPCSPRPAGWLRHKAVRGACVAVGVLVAAALAVAAPGQALAGAAMVAVALLLAGAILPGRSRILLAGGGLGAAVAIAVGAIPSVRGAVAAVVRQAATSGAWGVGEQAFRQVSASDSGVVVLAATLGWAPAGLFLGGLAVLAGCMLRHARTAQPAEQAAAIAWTAAAGIATAALLAPGGLFIPAVVLAFAFVWALLPAMLGRADPPRSNLYLLAAMGGLICLLGVVRQEGLLAWVTSAFGVGDAFIHVVSALLLTLLLTWTLGSRRLGLGLLAIALVIAGGGLGEVFQELFTARGGELRDWINDVLGCALATPLYLLCLGARWCESPDARAPLRL